MPTYLVCGLRIASDVPLPNVPVLAEGSDADVVVYAAALPPGAMAWSEAVVRPVHVGAAIEGSVPVVVADRPAADETLRLRYAEGFRAHVSARGDTVWCDWRAPLVEADAVTFLLGPVLGVILRRRGVLALHASAVIVKGGALAFLGPGGSGKSTLAAAFSSRGHAMLAEDILALRHESGAWWVEPAYGAVRLWEDSAGMVAPDRMLPPLSPTWTKGSLDLRHAGLPIAGSPAPLREVFVLEDPQPGVPEPSDSPLTAAAVLIELLANVYVNQLATTPELGAGLPRLRALAADIRGHRLRPGWSADGLRATVDFIAARAGRG